MFPLLVDPGAELRGDRPQPQVHTVEPGPPTKAPTESCKGSLRKPSSNEEPDTAVLPSLDHETTSHDVPHAAAASGDKVGITILTALTLPNTRLCPTRTYPPLPPKFY